MLLERQCSDFSAQSDGGDCDPVIAISLSEMHIVGVRWNIIFQISLYEMLHRILSSETSAFYIFYEKKECSILSTYFLPFSNRLKYILIKKMHKTSSHHTENFSKSLKPLQTRGSSKKSNPLKKHTYNLILSYTVYWCRLPSVFRQRLKPL